MKQKVENKTYLTPNEVANLLMVSPVTIRQWAAKGKLQAHTTPGGHRRFLYKDIIRFAKEHELALQSNHGPTVRVLIVDDDIQLAGLLTEMLAQYQDIETEIAYDGFDAGQKVQIFKPDVILLDIMMPGLDGIEVCRRLRNDPMNKNTTIIALTGHHTEENVNKMMAVGANACLAKPINIEDLFNEMGLQQLVA